MANTIKSPKKLIEVALPLEDINAAASSEKSIRHGHPSTLRLWRTFRRLVAAPRKIFNALNDVPKCKSVRKEDVFQEVA